MTIAFVQKSAQLFGDGVNTISPSLSSVAAGNLVVATVANSWNTNVGSSIATPSGWGLAIAPTGPDRADTYPPVVAIFYKVSTGGTESPTITVSGDSSAYCEATLSEFSSSTGWPANPVDVTASHSDNQSPGVTTGVTGTTGATAQAIALAIAMGGQSGATISGLPSTGYTSIDNEPQANVHCGYVAEYKILSATGAQSTSWGLSPAEAWAGAIVVFKPNASSSTDVAISGQDATLAQGALTAATDTTPTGQSATFAQGTLTADTSAAISGQDTTLATGTLGVDNSVAASGQDAALAQGTLTADTSVALTGQDISAGLGTLTADTSISVALTGQDAALALGQLGQIVDNNMDGVGAAISLGVLTPQYTPAPGNGASAMRRVWTQFQIDYLERLERERKERSTPQPVVAPVAQAPREPAPSPLPKRARKKPTVVARTVLPDVPPIDFWAQNEAIMRAAREQVRNVRANAMAALQERAVANDADEDEALLLAALD